MSVSNTDLRIVRTKESIRAALVDLIDEKSFEAVTVKDITTKAGINRGTFYAHYQDKCDLVAEHGDEIISELAKIAKQGIQDFIAGTDPVNSHGFPLAVTIFECLNKNAEFLRVMLGPKGDLSFQTNLKEFMWETLFSNGSDEAAFNKKKMLVPGEYLVAYIASAHMGIIQQWLDTGMKESPEEMARILFTLTVDGPFYAAGVKKQTSI